MASYITTADAISKYFSDDPEWRRLSEAFHSIARVEGERRRQPKDVARDELKKREDYLFDNVYQAVVQQALQVLLMDGSRTFQLPGLYTYDTYGMTDALRSGWAAKLRLTGPDTIWNGARLVFTEENWRQWLKSQGTSSSEADVRKSAGEQTGIAQAETVAEPGVEPTGIVQESRTPVPASKERLKDCIARIAKDRLRLRRVDFNALCRYLGFKPNEFGKLWHETAPEDWRKKAGGAPRGGAMVSDWRAYLPETPDK